jgi:superfamily II DNA/RNA helicase
MIQGVDLPDIELVIQWRVTCDMCTLWQHFGQAARNKSLHGIGMLLVEPKYFDATKEKAAARLEAKKRKAVSKLERSGPSKKRKKRTVAAPEAASTIVTPEAASATATGTKPSNKLNGETASPIAAPEAAFAKLSNDLEGEDNDAQL